MIREETACAVRDAGLPKLIHCNPQASSSNFFPLVPDEVTVELVITGLKLLREAGVGDKKLSIVEGPGGPQISFAM